MLFVAFALDVGVTFAACSRGSIKVASVALEVAANFAAGFSTTLATIACGVFTNGDASVAGFTATGFYRFTSHCSFDRRRL